MLKKILFLLMVTGMALASSGCYDKIELENRGFVNTMGIDSANSRVSLSLIMASLEPEPGEPTGGESGESGDIRTVESEALSSAMRLADAQTSKSVYYGLTKVCVLSGGLLTDETLLREVLDGLERNPEISRKLIMLAAEGSAEKLLSEEIKDGIQLGIYVTEFYQNKKGTAFSLRLNLENMAESLRENGFAIIPMVKNDEGAVKFSGAAVVKDYKLAGYLSERELRGIFWAGKNANGAQVLLDENGLKYPLKVVKSSRKLNFYENSLGLVCEIKIYAEGSLEEFPHSAGTGNNSKRIAELEEMFAEEIAREITETFELLTQEYGVDGFGLAENLRKWHNSLYREYAASNSQFLSEIQFIPNVTVKITNAGSVR